MKKLKPENFLEIEELSALENETLKGGTAESDVKVEKKVEKKKIEKSI
ncbi:hypothetical protein [Myroides sp. TSA_177.3]